MFSSSRKRCGLGMRWIIGVAALLLVAGCSALRLGYAQGPQLAYWWIDGRLDLDANQTPQVRQALDRWFDWHRRVEMPRYAALLARARRDVQQPALSAEQMCFWRDEAQRRAEAALEEAAPALAALMLTLSPAQIRHLEGKLAKDQDKLKEDFAQADRAERAKASFKRTLERYENLYGRLDEAQQVRMRELLAASPFDADRWLAERDQRNRDLIALVSGVAAAARSSSDPAAAQAQARAAVRVLGERQWRSPRADYREHAQRVDQANCALAAQMHGVMTAAQRQRAAEKLKGWEDDVRLIVAEGAGPAGAAGTGMAPAPSAYSR